MTRHDTPCGSCDRPTAGARLCDRCQITFEWALVNVAAYYADLDLIATKRTRYGSSGAAKGSIGKTVPLPIDGRFAGRTGLQFEGRQVGILAPGAQLREDTHQTLVTWYAEVATAQPPMAGPTCPIDTCLHTSCAAVRRRRPAAARVSSLIHYLARQFRWLVTQDWAPQMFDEIHHLENRLARFVDRPADTWYAGRCSAHNLLENTMCTAELYARTDHGFIDCKACNTRHDVATRRDFLLDEAKDVLVTATEAAGALLAWTDYGGTETKLVDRIRKWRDRGRLDVRDVTSLHGKDRHLYRLGDIQDLLVEHAQERQPRIPTA